VVCLQSLDVRSVVLGEDGHRYGGCEGDRSMYGVSEEALWISADWLC
jgi:hypothetical protein